jgi:glucokinase
VRRGIVEAAPHFRDWCMDIVRASTELRDEQRQIVQFAVVPDLDMAGARGDSAGSFANVSNRWPMKISFDTRS